MMKSLLGSRSAHEKSRSIHGMSKRRGVNSDDSRQTELQLVRIISQVLLQD
jgi:hypothetical protein